MRRALVAMVLFPLLLFGGTGPAQAVVVWPQVHEGASGPKVTAIQHLLTARGFPTTADGQFGPVTASKVRSFQASRNLEVDGWVGPQTWPLLVVEVWQGSTGSAVRAAQVMLRAHGYGVAVDGQFGSQTAGAVRSFQTARGLTAESVRSPGATWSVSTAAVRAAMRCRCRRGLCRERHTAPRTGTRRGRST
jgi:peptidoglycan hydrolase-like protein with peptidoglycan-binding domain